MKLGPDMIPLGRRGALPLWMPTIHTGSLPRPPTTSSEETRSSAALQACCPHCLPATTHHSGLHLNTTFTKTTTAQYAQSLSSVLTWPFRNWEAEVYRLDILPTSMKYESSSYWSQGQFYQTLLATSRVESAITPSHIGGLLRSDSWRGWTRAQQRVSPGRAMPTVLGQLWLWQRTGVWLHAPKENCLLARLFSNANMLTV